MKALLVDESRTKTRRAWWLASVVACQLGCSDAPKPPPTRAPLGRRACDTLAVVETDYQSTNVALVSSAGEPLAESLVSSGTRSPGLSAALSGDVALPSEAPSSGQLVLIDRTPSGVITWMSAGVTAVRAQLNVGAGFAANPHDYLEIDANRAWITRYGHNPAAGMRPFDEGSDLLVVDPAAQAIVGRIDLRAYAGSVLARPDRMLRVGNSVYVVLGRLNASYTESADGMLLELDVQQSQVVRTLTLQGARNCTGLARSATGDKLAVACSGVYPARLAPAPELERKRQLAQSAVVIIERADMQESMRFAASASGELEGPFGTGIAFASETEVLATTVGELSLGLPDRVLRLDLSARQATLTHAAASAFSLGDVRCEANCGTRCMFTEASPAALWVLQSPTATAQPFARSGRTLLPRLLGGFGK